jgi:hypothetical protein
MDAHKVEAMLMLEANINTSSSRTRFRHLSQFLGKSLFEYKRKWQNQFCGQEFLHTKKTHELKDKPKFYYWYKLPVDLLKHYASFIFSGEDFVRCFWC